MITKACLSMLSIFIKKIFGKEEDSGVNLGRDFWKTDEKVT
jgi:hypothetical protein